MTTTVPVRAASSGVARGISFALLSYGCFSTADAMVKLASEQFAVAQIAFIASLFALVPVVLLTRGQGGLRALLPVAWRLVLLRAGLTTACALLAWQAFSLLPLADGYAILFASPMLVTALSVPLLGEQVGWRRWMATLVGFVGVVIMIRPDFDTLTLGHALAAGAAIFGSLGFIVLRRIGPTEKSAPILFMLFGTIAS
jgi:drug/metabolite transporter (DMT)-like permease